MSRATAPTGENIAVSPEDLTLFQQNILLVIANDPARRMYGLAIKDELEDLYGEDVNHGRLYPNLDDLVDDGLLAKGELDKRTNYYELTDAGSELIRRDAQRRWNIADSLVGGDFDGES